METSGAEVRLLPEDSYQRTRFMVWMGVLVVLSGLYLLSRRLYVVGFLVVTAIALLLPLAIRGPWVAFLNAAIQGVLLSLLVPILVGSARAILKTRSSSSVAVALFLAGGLISTQARAESAAMRAATSPTLATVLVPYNTASGPDLRADREAYVSRDDFTRLWAAANRRQDSAVTSGALLAGMNVDGALDVERSVLKGRLTVDAANPGGSACDRIAWIAGRDPRNGEQAWRSVGQRHIVRCRPAGREEWSPASCQPTLVGAGYRAIRAAVRAEGIWRARTDRLSAVRNRYMAFRPSGRGCDNNKSVGLGTPA